VDNKILHNIMEVYFQLIKDAETLRKACEELENYEILGFDVETTSLDPHEGKLRLVQLATAHNKAQVVDIKAFPNAQTNPDLEPLRRILASKTSEKVAHNAKFDTKWAKHHLGVEVGKTFDTYLASQLISAGEQDRRHSLAEVANFFIGQELDKTQQVSDWNADLSAEQIEYAAKDAAIMIPLREKMLEKLKQDELERVANLEFESVVPLVSMELTGIFLDKDRWNEQLNKVKKLQVKLADELQDLLSAGVAQASLFGRSEVNLDSQAQVSDALKNLGIPMPDSTRHWELQPLAGDYPVITKLLEYRSVQKSLTSFGDNILEFIKPQTGRIHADFRQIGAATGRMSCSKPNLQQIPHGDEYRRCFRGENGRKLIIADYSQIELRILADFSDDENFIEAFESGADFHAITASQVFGISSQEVTSEQRSFAKRLNFGVVYGIGAQRFALMTGVSTKEAENMMRRYFGTYSKLDSYLRESGQNIVKNQLARTATGRMLRLRIPENDYKAIAAAKRYGINMPIQGTSADILKRAIRLLHNGIASTSAKLVNIVHDEIVVEADANEAENIAKIIEKAMVSAGNEIVKKVPIKVDVKIADEWAK
jgi:DNA polymerase I